MRLSLTSFLFTAFSLLNLPALCQTRPTLDQIHGWSQVSPPPTAHPHRPIGTSLTLDQIQLDPTFVSYWTELISHHTYHHYLVALDPDQTSPVLIVCLYPVTAPFGSMCVEGYSFWFQDLPLVN